jgi:TM2 domain-containing membrane protein YozV
VSSAGEPVRPYQPLDYPPQLRASDAQRDAVADVVRTAVADGRLGLDEIDSRLQQVYDAKTHGELTHVISDLVRYQPPMRLPVRPPAAVVVPGMASDRKIGIAFVLCFFLGVLGIHRFYAGRTRSGVAMLLISVLSGGVGTAVTVVWALIDLIILACGSFRDGDGRPMRNWG